MKIGERMVQHADAVALALAVCVVTLRMLCAWTLEFPPRGDYLAYFTMAQRLSEGEIIKDHFGNLAYYNVGYPLVLGVAFWLFGVSVWTAWGLNALCGGVSVYLVYRLAKRATLDVRIGLLAAGIWASYVAGYVYGAYIAKENLTLLLFLAQCLIVVRFSERRYRRSAALALGALTGFQALAASSSLAVVPVLVWAVWKHSGAAMARVGTTLIFLAAALVVVAPWMARNFDGLGKPVLNSNGGFNLYLGNNPSATGYFVSIADTPLAEKWHTWRESGELYADRKAGAAAMAYIASHPVRTAFLALKKTVVFWWPPVHGGKRLVHPAEHFLRKVWLIQYSAIIGLAYIGLWTFSRHARGALLPLFGMIVAYALLHAAFYIIYRYRLPVMPLITVIAAMAIFDLVVRRTAGVRPGDRRSADAAYNHLVEP